MSRVQIKWHQRFDGRPFRYSAIRDGEVRVSEFEANPNLRVGDVPLQLVCCDCGLVHDVVVRPTNGGATFWVWRNEFQTGVRRKARP